MPDGRIRVLRIIARLNMGGPAHQVALLSGRRFHPDRYETLLVHGVLAAGEESLAAEAEREGAQLLRLASLGQPIQPASDVRCLGTLVRLIRRFRPHVIHTHTAKAGMLGRLAALLAGRPRPVLVHTYHGHVLEGYFGRSKSALFRFIERQLAQRTDALLGVSQATVDDLVRLGVADSPRFKVMPLGLDLGRFEGLSGQLRDSTRERLCIERDDILCTFVGRIVPIKRVDLLLEAIAIARRSDDRIRLMVVGDGKDRSSLERRAASLGISDEVLFVGYQSELAPLWAASDIAVLSSLNEGTPVSLIEAGASGVPAVATDVGGVRETLGTEGSILVASEDVEALARGISDFASDGERRHRAGLAARTHSTTHFGIAELIARIDALYTGLLVGRTSIDAP